MIFLAPMLQINDKGLMNTNKPFGKLIFHRFKRIQNNIFFGFRPDIHIIFNAFDIKNIIEADTMLSLRFKKNG
jgi:hypothetical protein